MKGRKNAFATLTIFSILSLLIIPALAEDTTPPVVEITQPISDKKILNSASTDYLYSCRKGKCTDYKLKATAIATDDTQLDYVRICIGGECETYSPDDSHPDRGSAYIATWIRGIPLYGGCVNATITAEAKDIYGNFNQTTKTVQICTAPFEAGESYSFNVKIEKGTHPIQKVEIDFNGNTYTATKLTDEGDYVTATFENVLMPRWGSAYLMTIKAYDSQGYCDVKSTWIYTFEIEYDYGPPPTVTPTPPPTVTVPTPTVTPPPLCTVEITATPPSECVEYGDSVSVPFEITLDRNCSELSEIKIYVDGVEKETISTSGYSYSGTYTYTPDYCDPFKDVTQTVIIEADLKDGSATSKSFTIPVCMCPLITPTPTPTPTPTVTPTPTMCIKAYKCRYTGVDLWTDYLAVKTTDEKYYTIGKMGTCVAVPCNPIYEWIFPPEEKGFLSTGVYGYIDLNSGTIIFKDITVEIQSDVLNWLKANEDILEKSYTCSW